MRFFIICLTTIQITFTCLSQTPGGVSGNFQLWLKANSGVLTSGVPSMNGGNVNTWLDQSGGRTNDATDALLSAPTYRSNTADNINYNPVIDFDGVDDGLDYGDDYIFSSGTGGENGMSWFAFVQPDVAPLTKDNQFIFDFGAYAGQGYGLQYGYSHYAVHTPANLGGVFSTRIAHSRQDQSTLLRYSINLGTSQGLFFDGSSTAIYDSPITTTALSSVELNASPTHDSLGGFGAGPFTIGHQCKPVFLTNNGGRLLDGSLPELIGYNRQLSTNETSRIESYLAIKYGLTLNNSGGGAEGDYLATNSSTIWDASLIAGYHNDVIGIGRDDTEALLQKQSHTMDDTTRMYISSLASDNASNGGSFTSDISYVLAGHDQGKVCATTTSISEMPTGLVNCNLYSRIEREWKITKTNFSQTFNMDLTLSSCANTDSVNVSELRILIDDDGDFSNGGTTCYYNGDGTGIVISYTEPIITVSNISNTHIPDNQTRYMTVASILPTTPLFVDLLFFKAKVINRNRVDLVWATVNEVDNDYFEIHKSIDLENWEFVTQMDGAGNSTELLSYATKDLNPYTGLSYYKLTQTDFDGASSVEGIRSVLIDPTHDGSLSIYPNPTSGELKITGEQNELHNLQLINSIGQRVKMNILASGSQNITIDISNLASGVYFLRSDEAAYKIVKE